MAANFWGLTTWGSGAKGRNFSKGLRVVGCWPLGAGAVGRRDVSGNVVQTSGIPKGADNPTETRHGDKYHTFARYGTARNYVNQAGAKAQRIYEPLVKKGRFYMCRTREENACDLAFEHSPSRHCDECGTEWVVDAGECPTCGAGDEGNPRLNHLYKETQALKNLLHEVDKWCSGENQVGDGEDAEDALKNIQNTIRGYFKR